MNKIIAAIIGGIIVLGVGTFIIISRGTEENTAKVTNVSTDQSLDVKTGEAAIVNVDACDVLTEAVAKSLLGDGAEKGDTSAGAASTDDVSVTNCVYTYKAVTTGNVKDQLASIDHAAVLARSAKTKTGAESNKTPFTSAKPSGVQDVSGVGDQAYFNSTTGQLNVLKGGNWYIISRYKGNDPTAATLEGVKQLATAMQLR